MTNNNISDLLNKLQQICLKKDRIKVVLNKLHTEESKLFQRLDNTWHSQYQQIDAYGGPGHNISSNRNYSGPKIRKENY